MTSETDAEFMDRVDLDLDLNNTADLVRLFAIARRGAAMYEAHAVGFRDGAAHMHKAQTARIKRLEAALRPFAGIKADDGDDFSKWPDEVTIKCYALVHQIKEARAALEGE